MLRPHTLVITNRSSRAFPTPIQQSCKGAWVDVIYNFELKGIFKKKKKKSNVIRWFPHVPHSTHADFVLAHLNSIPNTLLVSVIVRGVEK